MEMEYNQTDSMAAQAVLRCRMKAVSSTDRPRKKIRVEPQLKLPMRCMEEITNQDKLKEEWFKIFIPHADTKPGINHNGVLSLKIVTGDSGTTRDHVDRKTT